MTPTPAEATTVSTESAETQLLEIYSLYNYEMVLNGNMSKRLGESVCLTLPCFNHLGWLSNTGTCHFQIWEAEGCTRMYTHHKDHLLTSLTNRQITVKHTSAKACPGSKMLQDSKMHRKLYRIHKSNSRRRFFLQYIFHSFIFLYDSPNRNIVFSHSFCETHRFFQLKAVKQGFSENSPLFWTEPFLLRTSCFLTG